VYDTCCRLCGVCQGSGRHDACCAGGATEDKAAGSSSAAEEAEGEAAALLAADYALELRRRAFDFQLQGDSAGAKQLLADSGEQLELAKSRVPRGSKLAGILEAAVHAWRRAEGLTNDNDSNECVEDGFEERVDQELERLVAELEKVLQETAPTAARRMPDSGTGRGSSAIVAASTALVPHCRFGCGRVANTSKRGAFDTCCRACAMSQGVGGHDSGCTGAATSEPTDALVPISTDLVPLSSAVEARAEGHAGGAEGAHRPEQPALGSPAQQALRLLALDDEWPTSLTTREIRRRFMREALGCHPDKGPPEEKAWRTTKFQELSDAYSTLEVQMAILERIRGPGVAAAAPEQGAGGAGGAREQQSGQSSGSS
ncbi:unnamed protein product, partial [Polarella glacialis]